MSDSCLVRGGHDKLIKYITDVLLYSFTVSPAPVAGDWTREDLPGYPGFALYCSATFLSPLQIAYQKITTSLPDPPSLTVGNRLAHTFGRFIIDLKLSFIRDGCKGYYGAQIRKLGTEPSHDHGLLYKEGRGVHALYSSLSQELYNVWRQTASSDRVMDIDTTIALTDILPLSEKVSVGTYDPLIHAPYGRLF